MASALAMVDPTPPSKSRCNAAVPPGRRRVPLNPYVPRPRAEPPPVVTQSQGGAGPHLQEDISPLFDTDDEGSGIHRSARVGDDGDDEDVGDDEGNHDSVEDLTAAINVVSVEHDADAEDAATDPQSPATAIDAAIARDTPSQRAGVSDDVDASGDDDAVEDDAGDDDAADDGAPVAEAGRPSSRQPDINENYEPVPLLSNLPPTPPSYDELIRRILRDELGFDSPRQFQVDAIFHLVFRDINMMYLIRKTGEGKSLVLLALAVILRRVVVVMGPLHGLGTDERNPVTTFNF